MLELIGHVVLYEGFSDLPGAKQQHLTTGLTLPAIPRPGDLDIRVKYIWFEANRPVVHLELEAAYTGHDGWDAGARLYYDEGCHA